MEKVSKAINQLSDTLTDKHSCICIVDSDDNESGAMVLCNGNSEDLANIIGASILSGLTSNDEQNNLKEHDFELIRQFYIDQIEGKSHRKISDKLLFQLEMYCQGSVFMTTQWVLGNKNFTPQELAGLLADAMPKELADVFREVNLI